MEIRDGYIEGELFSQCIEHMPQVCVEVVVENEGEILLAKRSNEPAEGEWFWPGGRLFKGERLAEAAHRVADEELGMQIEILRRLGVYAHFWETSAEKGRPSRHTVNVVFHVAPTDRPIEITLDDQHSDIRWISDGDRQYHEYVEAYLDDADLP